MIKVHYVQDEEEEEDEEGSLKDFIDDDESSEESVADSDSDIQELDAAGQEKKRVTRGDKVPKYYLLLLLDEFSNYLLCCDVPI